MKQTQNDMILQHLKSCGTITPAEALESYGCMRLAARIADLRAKGHAIESQKVRGTNRAGQPVTYSRYELREG